MTRTDSGKARVQPIAPAAVPTLDEVVADPTRASSLPAGSLQALLCRCVMAQTVLLGALVAGSAPRTDAPVEPDALLDVKEAAKRMASTKDWLYRHSRRLPFTVRNGRQLRFSAAGIARYIRERQGSS
jgi:hypothetical protein